MERFVRADFVPNEYYWKSLSEKLSREDTAGWMLETFRTGIRIWSKGTEQVLETADQARSFLRERERR